MLVYCQSTGELRDDAVILGRGWAGRGDGRNNPAMQFVYETGPLPRGRYTIAAPVYHPRLGPLSYRLTPDPANEMQGRDGFFIHGASVDPSTRGQESKGCIVMSRSVREVLAPFVGQQLEVIEGRTGWPPTSRPGSPRAPGAWCWWRPPRSSCS